jgi:hypothetical protein
VYNLHILPSLLSPVITTLLRTAFKYLTFEIARDELCIASVESVHFILLPKFEIEGLRHTDAKVYAATHPGVRARQHVNRYHSLILKEAPISFSSMFVSF